MDYKGYINVSLTDTDLAKFYNGDNSIIPTMFNNEYLLLSDAEGKIIDKYYYRDNKFEQVRWKPFYSALLGEIKPLNVHQELGFHMLQSADTTLKVFNSDFGVGKSFLCANYMFEALQKGKFNKAVLVRPNIGLEDYPSLGSIPGDYMQKILPWFGMFGDIVGSMSVIEGMIENEQLELAPLETIRGRSFQNSIIFIEECGNLTTATCRLLVSRCGKGSIILMCGDESQADKKRFREDNGLKNMSEALIGNKLFSYLHLEECVRSETARLCELF